MMNSFITAILFYFLFTFSAVSAKKPDSTDVKALLKLSATYIGSNFSLALKYANQAKQLAISLNNSKLIATSYSKLSQIHVVNNDFENAVINFQFAFEHYLQAGDTVSAAYNLDFSCYYNSCLGKYQKASDGLLQSLSLTENKKFEKCRATTFMIYGFLYRNLQNYDKAMYFFNKCHDISKDDNRLIETKFTALNEIGNMYVLKKDYKKALSYQHRALKIKEKINERSSLGYSYNDMANTYLLLNNIDSAQYYFNKALRLGKEDNNKMLEATALSNLGEIYKQKKDFKKAIEFLQLSCTISIDIKDFSILRNGLYQLGNIYFLQNDFKNSTLYYREYILVNDSVMQAENTLKITEIQEKYHTEKKEQEIILLQKDKQIKEEEMGKQKIIKFALIGILVLIISLAFVLLKAFLTKKKTNKILQKQKEEISEKNEELQLQKEEITVQRDEIEVQKSIIEEKSEEVKDSIEYAKRIQDSILPPLSQIEKIIPDSFILYLPKDIVSGDFYWVKQQNNKILLAAADCTGHGVPGGFMSMIGIDKLQEASDKSDDVSKILTELNISIKNLLHQTDTVSILRDGMDIALCSIEPLHDGSSKILFAGAYRPLWILRNDSKEMVIFESDKTSLGGTTDTGYIFKVYEYTVFPGDCLYLFSDGFVDQFGGTVRKKFLAKNLKTLLIANSRLPMAEQKQILKNTLYNWMGNNEQIDDILVMGVRI